MITPLSTKKADTKTRFKKKHKKTVQINVQCLIYKHFRFIVISAQSTVFASSAIVVTFDVTGYVIVVFIITYL